MRSTQSHSFDLSNDSSNSHCSSNHPTRRCITPTAGSHSCTVQRETAIPGTPLPSLSPGTLPSEAGTCKSSPLSPHFLLFVHRPIPFPRRSISIRISSLSMPRVQRRGGGIQWCCLCNSPVTAHCQKDRLETVLRSYSHQTRVSIPHSLSLSLVLPSCCCNKRAVETPRSV